MGSEWKEVTLGEVFKVKHGFAFKGEFFTDESTETVCVTPGNFAIGGGFQNPKPKYYNGPVPEEYILTPGQIVVTMTDLSKQADTLGFAATIPDDEYVWLHNQRVGLREFNDDIKTDPQFISYLLRTHQYRSWIVGSATGTTVKHTSPSRIESYSCFIPPYEEQVSIGNTLAAYERKIALNRQINTTLESMAQALFKSWFVDFDPVIDNALAAGNEIPDELAARAARRETLRQQTNKTANETSNKTTGATDAASPEQALPETGLSDQRLPCEIQQLFPDRFVLTDEMGWVPEGWEVVDVEHILKRLKVKKRYKKGDVSSSGRTPVYEQGADILLGFNEEEAEIEASVNDPAFIFGDHTCVTRLSTIPFSISENVIALKPSKYDGYWTYHAYRDKQQFEEYRRHWMELIVRPVVVPTPQLASTFGSAVRGYYERSELVMRENTSLEDLRDSLLPKLLSGQITIPDAEQQLAEVL